MSDGGPVWFWDDATSAAACVGTGSCVGSQPTFAFGGLPTPIIPFAVGATRHDPLDSSAQPLGTNTRASPSSTGAQPDGTPTPRWASNCAAVTTGVVAAVSV